MTVSGANQKSNGKLILFIILFMIGLALFGLIGLYPHHMNLLFLSGFFISFAGMLGMRHFWPVNWGVLHMLTLALVARCFLLPLAPGDDLNRYLWEGKCQLNSINPYIVSPLDTQTEPLRDKIWQGVNHKEFTTIYGPLAQLVFKASALIRYSPFTLKIIIVIFDIGTLLVLLLFLKKRGSRIQEALLYAANPLVLFSFAGEGHMESMMLCMLAIAFLSHKSALFGRMFFFLGAACCVKLTALLFIPLFLRKETHRYIPFVLLPALLFIPFGWSGMLSLLDVMARFAGEFRFNGFLFEPLAMVLSTQAAMIVCTAVFSCVYLWNVFLTPDPVKASGNIALGLLLCSPTAHPWYFTIVAMFTVIYPIRSWIVLTGTMGVSWLISFQYWATGIWKERFGFYIFEYAPPVILEIAGRFIRPEYASPGYGIPESIAVIIPALNEGDRLRECLESIKLPGEVQSEIVVADGGSTDTTVSIAKSDARVSLIASPKGRGIQIAEGVSHSRGDLIIIVHADTCLAPAAIGRIHRFCVQHPYLGGGSVAARFSASGLRFTLITVLNIFRSRFTGISFGDQVQFFRRHALKDALPGVKLMEDVEISLLLKERGPVAVLPCLAQSSARRWQSRAYAGNMITVIALTIRYLVRRRCGLLKGDNSDFYRSYYGKP